jgi:hypothetical protein
MSVEFKKTILEGYSRPLKTSSIFKAELLETMVGVFPFGDAGGGDLVEGGNC